MWYGELCHLLHWKKKEEKKEGKNLTLASKFAAVVTSSTSVHRSPLSSAAALPEPARKIRAMQPQPESFLCLRSSPVAPFHLAAIDKPHRSSIVDQVEHPSAISRSVSCRIASVSRCLFPSAECR